MAPQLAQRLSKVALSKTLVISAAAGRMRKAGKDVINLATGESDLNTPDNVKLAAKKAIDGNKTRYTPVTGTDSLREAISMKLERDNALHYTPDEIIVSCGGKHVVFNLCQALLDPGDEVVIPCPYWVSYPEIAKLAGAEPIIVDTFAENHYKLTSELLEQAITPQTKLLILNSPSNPTGGVYSEAELKALAEVLLRHPRVIVLTDDIYEHIVFRGVKFCNIVNVCPELRDRCVILNGVSKAYAMTGWRIGFGASSTTLINGMKKVQSQCTSNPSSIAQAAAKEAFSGPQGFLANMCSLYEDRHDALLEKLNHMPGVSCSPSRGSFYSFPDFSDVIEGSDKFNDDVELAEYILQETYVAIVPGAAFGKAGHLRISFSISKKDLLTSIDRITALLSTC